MSRVPVEIVDIDGDERVVIRSINSPHRVVLSAELSNLLRVKAAVEIAEAGGSPKLLMHALADGLTRESAQFLVDRIVGKKPGRPPGAPLAKRWVERVNEIKVALRARGMRRCIHAAALAIFEEEYALVQQHSAKFGWAFHLPDFDRQRFENRNRRSGNPRRSRGSRGK